MAGFFGLFDYSKPGPGVDKNAPRKKGFVVFFEIYFRKFWKLILVNLLYVLVSLPVVTHGLANAGLTYITRNYAREKHAFISGDFFDTIKKNWKQALPIGIINLLITAVLVFDVYWFYMGSQNIMGIIMLAVIMSVYVIFTFMKYYIYMMMITFKFSIKQLYKNSFIFALAGLKRNLLISVFLILLYAIGVLILFANLYIGITILLFVYIFLFPAFRSFLIQYNIFPTIKSLLIDPYYEKHPGEDKDAIRALNIEDTYSQPEDKENEEEEEVIFTDVGRGINLNDNEEENKWQFPKQYSEQERAKHRTSIKRQSSYDDDDTI